MEQAIFVYIDLMNIPMKVGQLWGRFRNGRESMSFEYDRNWLNHPKRFSLDPALKLVAGSFHASSDKPLFGAIDDSAPDRWGRLLMRRSERKNAEHEKRTARALKEIDFLLMVDDEGRQGALRFKTEEQGPFLTTYDKNPIPPLVAIGKLLTAASHVIQDSDTEEDIKPRILSTAIDLVDPSASLDVAVSVAHYFALDNFQAKKILKEVGSATALWREEAAKLKLKKTEIDRMASAFEHEEKLKYM